VCLGPRRWPVSSERALVLRWPRASCVVQAGDVLAIDEDGPGSRIRLHAAPLALAASVPGAVDDPDEHHALRLIVRTRHGHLGFRAAAAIEIREGLRFYALPRLLRSSATPPWLRGMALVHDPSGDERPLPWLHLGELGDWHLGQQAQMVCAEG
jgi:hypothetical protein